MHLPSQRSLFIAPLPSLQAKDPVRPLQSCQTAPSLVFSRDLLPSELWSEIFMQVSAFDATTNYRSNRRKDADAILLVCHSFRDIALHTPRMWTNIVCGIDKLDAQTSILGALSHIHTWARRAGGLGLALTLDLKREVPGASSCLLYRLVRKIIELSDRWVDLDLPIFSAVAPELEPELSGPVVRSTDSSYLGPSPLWTNLCRLKIVFSADPWIPTSTLLAFHRSPKLCYVSCNFVSAPVLRLHGISAHLIKSVCYKEIKERVDVRNSAPMCEVLLRCWETLESLDVSLAKSFRSHMLNCVPTTLPRLRRLKLRCPAGALKDILDGLTCPEVQSLVLEQYGQTRTDMPVECVRGFCSRSGGGIKELGVRDFCWSAARYCSLFEVVPDIECLSVHGHTGSPSGGLGARFFEILTPTEFDHGQCMLLSLKSISAFVCRHDGEFLDVLRSFIEARYQFFNRVVRLDLTYPMSEKNAGVE